MNALKTQRSRRRGWQVAMGLLVGAMLAAGVGSTLRSGAALAAGDRLVITGSSSVAPLIAEVAKRFEQENSGLRIDVQSGGSSRGIADVRGGLADIGMVSRALKADEGDLHATTVALDGITIILHSSNPVTSLTDEQVSAVYLGTITNWKALGGSDQSITVVNKAEGRSTLELFLAYTGLKNSQIKASVVIGDNQQGIKSVAANPGAIGYVSVGAAEFEASQGTAIKGLPMRGISAQTSTVRNGSFPLSRPLNLITRGAPGPLASRFIAFAASPAVSDLVQAQYLVPPEQH